MSFLSKSLLVGYYLQWKASQTDNIPFLRNLMSSTGFTWSQETGEAKETSGMRVKGHARKTAVQRPREQ